MGIRVGSGFCPVCLRNVMTHENGPNHILHLILTLVTGGLWIIVWIVVAARRRPQNCTVCGSDIWKANKSKSQKGRK